MYKSESFGKGGIESKVVAHTIGEHSDSCATTFQLKYPRFIHQEFLTHRVFGRNASSSRAIPVEVFIKQVLENPAMPIHWGKNQRGMQAYEEIEAGDVYWCEAAKYAVDVAEKMVKKGYHKQITNRLLEPFQFINVVMTATELDNFFKLRDHKSAQPEIKELAVVMKESFLHSSPDMLLFGEWHTPYVLPEEKAELGCYGSIVASSARCARTSYNKHDKTKPTFVEDADLHDMLAVRPYHNEDRNLHLEYDEPVHLSPLEHQLTPMPLDVDFDVDGVTHLDRCGNYWSGNVKHFIQYRQLVDML